MKRLNDLGFIPGVSTGRDTATNGLAPAHGTGLDDGAVGWNAAREDGVVVAEDATVENQQRQHSDVSHATVIVRALRFKFLKLSSMHPSFDLTTRRVVYAEGNVQATLCALWLPVGLLSCKSDTAFNP